MQRITIRDRKYALALSEHFASLGNMTTVENKGTKQIVYIQKVTKRRTTEPKHK